MPYTFLIVDDEQLSRSYVRNLILDCEHDATIYDARSVSDALPILSTKKIDVLFLDIKMPDSDGFDLLSAITERNFELIFITAYSNYAIKAIREGALDYLLKPIRITEFKAALYKAIGTIKAKESTTKITPTEKLLNHTLTFNTHAGTKFALVKHIIYIQADNTYSIIVLAGGERIVTTWPIKKLEASLSTKLFFRIHKSFIINIYHFKEHNSAHGDIAVMDNGKKLAISRYRLKAFIDFVANNSKNETGH